MDETDERPFFHEGMRALQDQMDGRRTADAIVAAVRHFEFSEADRKLITEAPCVFIASAWNDHVDCSMKSGDPGFVKIVGPGVLEYPEYDGNSMYRTLGNIRQNPNIGLLFVKFDGRTLRMRINGRATILQDAGSLSRHHGARFVVRVDCDLSQLHPLHPGFRTGDARAARPAPGAGHPAGAELEEDARVPRQPAPR
ncbi:MAG: hypothetical protein DHS20C03_03910 [Minwuia thermotolerans]|nr:MAG: hypothetical protein DHS20C03_03910 [Minwuia thermotolerans]